MNPHLLADELVTLSGEYSNMSEELSQILSVKPIKWSMWRAEEGCKSDKVADRKWEASREGIREMQLKLIMRASEKRMSAIKAMLRVLEGESYNLH